MLTTFQDGYGPAGEYYHTGQYNGMPVSVLPSHAFGAETDSA
jgi:hypothetical protein